MDAQPRTAYLAMLCTEDTGIFRLREMARIPRPSALNFMTSGARASSFEGLPS